VKCEAPSVKKKRDIITRRAKCEIKTW